jgi:tetratricopeptide (TPR) repeat protein
MNGLKTISLFVILLCTPVMMAQEEFTDIRKGNKQYKSEKYTEAEISYRKGLQKNSQSPEAAYNLGNSLFKQEKYAEALEQYQKVLPNEKISKKKLASALHNTGNALLMQQRIPESIEAFKKSLKINPEDDETRYNLALAQYLLRNQDSRNQQDQQQQEQPQPENQENKREKDDSQQQQEEQPTESMPKDKAEQLLEALMQDEDETMEKAKKLPKSSKRTVEKNW